MPIVVTEKVDSRERTEGNRPRIVRRYLAAGSSDEAEIVAAVEAEAPGTYAGLKRTSVRVEPTWVDETAAAGAGDGLWTCDVTYERAGAVTAWPVVGDSRFSFDTSGGTQHVTQSRATVSRTAPAGQTAPDFRGAINVTSDSVDGVDIAVPVYSFAETHVLAGSAVTDTYKGTLFSLTGKVNSAAFKGLAAGECLFLGASGSTRGAGTDWEITYRFAASPNRTNIPVGDITVPAKKGWEYLWVRYADTEDAASNTLVKQPVAAYVEKVYDEGDFSLLGIGI